MERSSQGQQYSAPGWKDYLKVQQPNDDGYLTWDEATWQWQHGEGAPVTVDLDKLDRSGVRQSNFAGPGSRSLFSTAKPKDFLVHGTITLELNQNGAVSALSNKYNFDIQSWTPGTTVRNVEALGGRFLAGPGQEFLIRFQGQVPVPR